MKNAFDIDVNVRLTEYKYFISGSVRVKTENESKRVSISKDIKGRPDDREWEPASIEERIANKDDGAETMEVITILNAVIQRTLRRLDEYYDQHDPEEWVSRFEDDGKESGVLFSEEELPENVDQTPPEADDDDLFSENVIQDAPHSEIDEGASSDDVDDTPGEEGSDSLDEENGETSQENSDEEDQVLFSKEDLQFDD